jgi:hypothetical protein
MVLSFKNRLREKDIILYKIMPSIQNESINNKNQ